MLLFRFYYSKKYFPHPYSCNLLLRDMFTFLMALSDGVNALSCWFYSCIMRKTRYRGINTLSFPTGDANNTLAIMKLYRSIKMTFALQRQHSNTRRKRGRLFRNKSTCYCTYYYLRINVRTTPPLVKLSAHCKWRKKYNKLCS